MSGSRHGAEAIRFFVSLALNMLLAWSGLGLTWADARQTRDLVTVVHDNVTYMPVAHVGDAFRVHITVPTDTVLNRGFLRFILLSAVGLCVALAAILAAVWFADERAHPPGVPYQFRKVCLAAILIVAAALRFHRILQPYNDAYSWRQASTAMMADNFYRTNWNIFYPEVNWTGPGPNYQGREFQTVSYTAALLYLVFGQWDWVGRCVAIAFGLWGIWALYHLVRRVWDEERALASATVMAILPGSIFIERSFLPDPAMVALATTSVWMWVAYLQTERRRYFILAILIGAWAFLTKLPGVLVGLPMAYATFVILSRRQRLNLAKLTVAGGAALSMLTPAVAYYLWARHLALTYPPHHFAGSSNWVWMAGFKYWRQQSYFLPRLIKHIQLWLWTLPGVAIALVGLFLRPVGAKRESQDGRAPLLFHWWLVAGILYYIIGARELVDNPWNLHVITPAVAALVGHSLISIASVRGRIVRSAASVAAIVGLLLIIAGFGQSGLTWAYKPYAQESYKLGLALRQAAEPGDLVVTTAGAVGEPTAIYYSRQRGWVFPPYPSPLPQDDDEAIRLFEELRAQGADWLGIAAESKDSFWQDYPDLVEHIMSTCELYIDTQDYVIYRILAPEQIAIVPVTASEPGPDQ